MSPRKRTKDKWLPQRVYKGKSAYEYHPKEGGAIRLCGFEGDKQDEDLSGCIELNPATLPPGTRITVSVPVCPCCGLSKEMQDEEICQFDWAQWEISKYA